METLHTLDYDQFRSIVSNREVDMKHVRSLQKAIRTKNLLHLNPILCNRDLDVIDGQHRLEAARTLGVPIYYVVDGNISKKDIAAINSNSKNWKIMDYINFWTIEKKPGFDRLSAFLSENPFIQPSTALMLLSTGGTRNTKELNEWIVDVGNYEFAKRVASVLKEYRNMIDHAYDRGFIMAVVHVLSVDGYDHDQMRQKLEYQSRSLVRCINKKQYIELLEEIYNYHSSKNKVKFI